MSLDYHRYYDLETYLFEDVSGHFRDAGSIGAFDLFSIVIWKANRAKSITARRLLKHALPGESLDALCHRFTREVASAPDPESRFMRVVSSPWGFSLPMASAILTVLYPDTFTVYDYRVCEELHDFDNLANLTDLGRLWSGYSRFINAVKTASSGQSLRAKDRFLIGRSMASQLDRDIKSWFQQGESATT